MIEVLNEHINAVIMLPEFKERLADEGAEAAPPNTPAQFRVLIANQVRRWERFLKNSNLKLE